MIKSSKILFSFLTTFSSAACKIKYIYQKKINNSFLEWIRSNSSFSKKFLKSKCVLDKDLVDLISQEKKLIVQLIATSYQREVKKNEQYNF